MLHGGIRYLEQGHIKLVREALIERDEWQRVAPNATRVERFFFPIYGNSPRGRITLFTGALYISGSPAGIPLEKAVFMVSKIF